VSDLPPLLICATTYFPPGRVGEIRASIAYSTIASWNENLLYGGERELLIADDGSDHEWLEALCRHYIGASLRRQERHGVGASLNSGIALAHQMGALLLYAVDDWALRERFDITPWVRYLLAEESVGMVRVGMPHPGLTGVVEQVHEAGWGLRLDRHHFAFGHRPGLYHQRMFEAYGPFDEDVNALECERLYNERFCAIPEGPDIVLALHDPWVHVGGVELAYIDPRAGQ